MIDMIKSLFATQDELKVLKTEDLRSLINTQEEVMFSAHVQKINKRRVSQDRILILTDKHLYNICLEGHVVDNLSVLLSHSAALRRVIDISKINEMTVSIHPKSEQFIIHVDGEYDYRYDGMGKRQKIMDAICKCFFDSGKQQFTLYLKEVADLYPFHTSDDDLKANIIKKSHLGMVKVNKALWKKGLKHIIHNKHGLIEEDDYENAPTFSTVKQIIKDAQKAEHTQFYAVGIPFERDKQIKSIDDIPLTFSGSIPKSAVVQQPTLEDDLVDQMLSGQYSRRRAGAGK